MINVFDIFPARLAFLQDFRIPCASPHFLRNTHRLSINLAQNVFGDGFHAGFPDTHIIALMCARLEHGIRQSDTPCGMTFAPIVLEGDIRGEVIAWIVFIGARSLFNENALQAIAIIR